MPRLVLTNRAEQDLNTLPDEIREAVELQITLVGANPREEGWHLKGTYFCRWSSHGEGNRRILYRIEPGTTERVVILGVPHRNVAYPRSRH